MRPNTLAGINALSAKFSPTPIDVFFLDSDQSVFDDTFSDTERSRCVHFATPLLRERSRICHAGKRATLSRYLSQHAPARMRVPDANESLHTWQSAHIDDAGTSERAPLLIDVQAPPGYCTALTSDMPGYVHVFTLLAGHTNREKSK